MNIGLRVYHAIAGKKCMGIARPGKNSGFGISVGREMEMGRTILAKESRVKVRLKMISALTGNFVFTNQYPKTARRQPDRLNPTRLPTLISFEKFISKAKI